MTRIVAAVVMLTLLVRAARSELIEPFPVSNIRDDQSSVDVTDPGGTYASVGLLRSSGSVRSGTLIGEEWVLTAAHVAGSGPSQYQFEIGGNVYNAAEVIQEPSYSGSLFAGNDVALVRLAAPVMNVVPAALFNGSLSELGRVGTMVGFGSRGTGSAPNTLPQGTRHIGRNIIDTRGDLFDNSPDPQFDERILLTDFDSPVDPSESLFGDATPIDLESNVSGGDSGGALFVDFGSGERLVGVASFLGQNDGTEDGDYGDASGFIRVADHLAFIESNSGITPAAVPEPSPGILAISLVVCWLIVSRFGGTSRNRLVAPFADPSATRPRL